MSIGRREEPRSRWFQRWCSKRLPSGAKPTVKFPETPLILAGALGGPFCIFLYTPLRNALTLASQDVGSSAWEIYSTTFDGGFASGWTGGFAPVLPSCPQFCIMGPLFHLLKEAVGSAVLAVILSATAETTISIGSETLNAQLAFNREQLLAGTNHQVPLRNPLIPYGPGMFLHVTRNVVAMCGIRIFSRPCQTALECGARACRFELPQGIKTFLGDFVASMGAAVLSAPFNQLYNFAVTSQAYTDGSTAEKLALIGRFLMQSYLVFDESGRIAGLSSTLARDLGMRCAYVATLYATFGAIERGAVYVWDRRRKPKTAE